MRILFYVEYTKYVQEFSWNLKIFSEKNPLILEVSQIYQSGVEISVVGELYLQYIQWTPFLLTLYHINYYLRLSIYTCEKL